MTAVAVGTTTAEEVFALTAPRTRPAPAGQAAPRARLVTAPPPALVPQATGPGHPLAPTIRSRITALRAAQDLPAATEVDDERPSAVPPTDPAAAACAIALASLEALAGRRPVAQLARWLAPEVYAAIQLRTALVARVLAPPQGVRRPVVRRMRTTLVGATAHEVTVVVDDASRVRAVALRLEAHRGAWRATALEIG